ncbi:hypothetical protein COT97_00510 [Candidatus Falkowbacteria bacterium CG10_big_fil_rev_8_21_14_0_10_39_11]|uniref:Uncharacterized protein n=1 Tax=Candidatus Falkowbacteria bacterium CG10_big_fil_rev_8_21_14_0_10_39_11 TaxID=1974565 RepID=A0A2H0V8E8_9BACT|nr:MAG: hypothetical protein COT97_00510 [Candidatus Falkowbacteria bacterium CG10_big_fil_rev_8_21_14_0_10_39_11]
MKQIFKIPTWFYGGLVSLLIIGLLYYFNSIVQDRGLVGSVEQTLAAIVQGIFLIVTIPLYIVFSYIGFALDAILHTGVGYESLGVFASGILFIKIVSVIYYFAFGALSVVIYKKIKNS